MINYIVDILFSCRKYRRSDKSKAVGKGKSWIQQLFSVLVLRFISTTALHFSIVIINCIFFVLLISGCKKFVEVEAPKTELIKETVFNSDATAIAAQTDIYIKMGVGEGFSMDFTRDLSLSADEFVNYSTTDYIIAIYQNSVLTDNSSILARWRSIYSYIFEANNVLEGIEKSSGLSEKTKLQLKGEAKFIRAYLYFYLVNLYGDIPLIISTNYKFNATVSRASKSDVYQLVLSDLTEAKNLLSTTYLASDLKTNSIERVRPTKDVATALLARVYLYLQDWLNAETQASSVISNASSYNLVSNLDSVFLKNSRETILQLSATTNFNTQEGSEFILAATPSRTSLNPQLLNSFEVGDKRKSKWMSSVTVGAQTYFYPYKYKVRSSTAVSEYTMVLRLAEQYLIRSEARAQLNKILEAQADLNVIRNRSGLPNTQANDKSSLLLAIENERRYELFTEWGHRWLDLKRTGRIDTIMSAINTQKGRIWNTSQQLYPIPQAERRLNPNLSQNSGY